MESECAESSNKEHVIPRAFRTFLMIPNPEKEGAYQQYMDDIQPYCRGRFTQTHYRLIAVVNHDQYAEAE